MLLTPEIISKSELVLALGEFGGSWNDEPTLNHGVIQRGTATIYVNAVRAPSSEYSEEELTALVQSCEMGGMPKSLVTVDIGHGEGSLELASDIAHALVRRWSGMIDWNGVV